jgi:hypothetical protein
MHMINSLKVEVLDRFELSAASMLLLLRIRAQRAVALSAGTGAGQQRARDLWVILVSVACVAATARKRAPRR